MANCSLSKNEFNLNINQENIQMNEARSLNIVTLNDSRLIFIEIKQFNASILINIDKKDQSVSFSIEYPRHKDEKKHQFNFNSICESQKIQLNHKYNSKDTTENHTLISTDLCYEPNLNLTQNFNKILKKHCKMMNTINFIKYESNPKEAEINSEKNDLNLIKEEYSFTEKNYDSTVFYFDPTSNEHIQESTENHTVNDILKLVQFNKCHYIYEKNNKIKLITFLNFIINIMMILIT